MPKKPDIKADEFDAEAVEFDIAKPKEKKKKPKPEAPKEKVQKIEPVVPMTNYFTVLVSGESLEYLHELSMTLRKLRALSGPREKGDAKSVRLSYTIIVDSLVELLHKKIKNVKKADNPLRTREQIREFIFNSVSMR